MNESRPRIAFFMPGMHGGGVEHTFINLCNELSRQGHCIDLVVGSSVGEKRELVSPQVQLIDLNKTRMAASLFALAGYLRERKPKCLISGMEHANNVAILSKKIARADTKVIASIRNTLSVQYVVDNTRKSRITLRLAKLLYPMADVVHAVSHECAEDAAQVLGLEPKRIKVVYNPTVTPALYEKSKAVPDHPWLKDHQVPVVVSVGRLNAQKDYPTLFRAFAKVRSERECRLLILGDGELRSALEGLAKELGIEDSVSLPGFQINPYGYLAYSDVYVLSSLFEGLPNVLIEALACGIPIVATNCKSGPKEILAEGKWGKIVSIGDVDAMAQAITDQIVAGRVKRPEECCRPFTLETVSEQYLKMAGDD